jgi:hypothetical protein
MRHLPKPIEDARLLTGAVDEVVKALADYGADALETRFPSSINESIEQALLERNDKRINLALAENASSWRVVGELFARTARPERELIAERYRQGLRIACLCNAAGGIGDYVSLAGGDHLTAWLAGEKATEFLKHATGDEIDALLANPRLSPDRLADLYLGEGLFASLTDQRRRRLIWPTTRNSRLDTDFSSFDGPDMEHSRLEEAIGLLVTTAPLAPDWLELLFDLIDRRNPFVFSAHLPKHESINRWRDLRVSGNDDSGYWTPLTRAQEFCVLLASSCWLADDIGYADADSDDIFRRCAFYGRSVLKSERLAGFFERDKAVFVFAALQNPTAYREPVRSRFESECLPALLSGSNMWRRYKSRCMEFSKKHLWFDPRPVSDEGKDVLSDESPRTLEQFDQERRDKAMDDLRLRLLVLDRRQRALLTLTAIGLAALALLVLLNK